MRGLGPVRGLGPRGTRPDPMGGAGGRGRFRLGLLAGGVLGAGALAVWSAGCLAGFLGSGRFAVPSPSAGLGMLVRLLADPRHPLGAFPAPERVAIGRPARFFFALGLVGVVVALVAAGTLRVVARWRRPLRARAVVDASLPRGLRRRLGAGLVASVDLAGRLVAGVTEGIVAGLGRRPRREAFPLAAWASASELRALRVPGPRPGRLVLGRAGRHLLATESRHSVLVVGPSQSHKTSGFAIPAILEWAGPVVATSVKADLVAATIGWRREQGRVFVYDPAGGSGFAGSSWSPLAAATTWAGARRAAHALCAAAREPGTGPPDAEFWYSTAAKLLAPLLFAAALSGGSMADVVRWVDEQEVEAVEAILLDIGVPEALRAARASWQREERQRSSVYTTAETVLEAFADPTVAAATGPVEIDPARLVGGGGDTLFVCSPAHHQARFRPLFTALVEEVVTAAFETAALRGGPLDPPLLLVLDEAANVAPIRELDGIASTAAGHGIQLVTIWQDLAQVVARYGARSGTVVNNHRAKVVLSGIADPETLERLSALVGEGEAELGSTTTDADGRTSTTRAAAPRRLAPADVLRRIEPGQGVLVYGHLPPARIRLRPYFLEPGLARRSGPGGSPDAPTATA
jgi:type IV secretion system protein VirD4